MEEAERLSAPLLWEGNPETPHPDAALHIIPSRVFLLLLPLPFDTLPGSLVLCLGLLSGLSDQLVLSFSFSLYFP